MFFDGSLAFFGVSAGPLPRCSADFRGASEPQNCGGVTGFYSGELKSLSHELSQFLLLSATLAGADTISEALVNHCDPAKIATLSSERGANPRVRKICCWVERARLDGRDPAVKMRELMAVAKDQGWAG